MNTGSDASVSVAARPTAPLSAARAAVRDRCLTRVAAAEKEVAAAQAEGGNLALARLGVFLSIIATGWWAHAGDRSIAWLLVPMAVFAALVVRHRNVDRRAELARRRRDLHGRTADRIEGRWADVGDDGARFLDIDHPAAAHLDVFGRGSLFQRIDAARTSAGKETLAEWLTAPADPAAALRRQAAVAALRSEDDLREDLALLGGDAKAATLGGLVPWAVAPPRLTGTFPRALAASGPAIILATTLWWWLADGPFLAVSVAILLSWGLARQFAKEIESTLRGADASSGDLVLLSGLLERIEREEFRAPMLADAKDRLRGDGVDASRAVASLRRLMELRDAAANQMFMPVALVLLWPLQVALRVETWKRLHGARVEGWLRTVGEVEALASLAGYAAENPEDPFPEFIEGPPSFEAVSMSHPLLSPEAAVRNDLRLETARRVFVVSGSNMSGKSTFLRTLGANAVLAFAGAPVRAASLRLTPLAIGASIQVHDSLLDGESRFYAEVRRVALVVKMSRGGGMPLLFLLDELFHGTNSADRREGARAVVRALLDGGALGLITTHDLELARLAEDLDGAVENVHFEDRLEDGRMSFDYRLRPGVVERSNALALMRAVGLEV